MAETARHTPGSWAPARITIKQLNIIPVGNSFRCQIVGGEDGDARIVATVHGQTERECEANTLLIAATADILRALEVAEESLTLTLQSRGYAGGTCTDEWANEVRVEVAARSVARAAIARATKLTS